MRLWLILISLLTISFAGCLAGDEEIAGGDGSTDVANRWTYEEWNATISEPTYDDIESRIFFIDAADGTQLSLTLHLPVGLEAGETLPTLLQITPYQNRQANPDGTTGGPSSSWAALVLRGAAYVEADARGTNGSEGCLDFGGSADRSDAQIFAQWIRDQDWSNGRIVTDGVSHPGMGSIVAHAAVPDLTAALAHAPVVSYYQDQWILGARLEQINEFYQTTESQPALYPDQRSAQAQAAPCTGETLADYGQVDGPFGDLWKDRDLSRHAEAAAAPLLMTHGFVDLNVHPDHTQLYWDALPDDFPKYMVLGWWYHGWPDMDGGPADEFSFLRLRWLEATLFETDNGLWDEPRVLVEDSQGTWHEGNDWPLEQSQTLRFYPAEDGSLTDSAPGDGEATFSDPAPAESRRGSWTDASVLFRTEPLESAKLINGAPDVHLVASSSAEETKWVTYLIDEAPDGSWEWISHSYADSHSWGEEDEWLAMQPGTEYEWDIKLFPTAVVVEEGHTLLFLVTSQDSGQTADFDGHCWDDYRGGCYDPTGILPSESAGNAENTVHLGSDGTWVELSWADPALTQKATPSQPQQQ